MFLTTVKGFVLGPDGQPIAGAEVCLWPKASGEKSRLRVRSGKDGRFHFETSKAVLNSGGMLVAAARGYGPDWAQWSTRALPGEVTLRLARDDVPIAGRVIDLEGLPVAGVVVSVLRVAKRADGDDLTAWIRDNARQGTLGYPVSERGLKTLPGEAACASASVTTGKDGRFRLVGFGRERALLLELRGPAVEHVRIWAVTRAGRGLVSSHQWLYAARFEHALDSEQRIVGTVRHRRTGKPLPGLMVQVFLSGKRAITDKHGRYQLTGVPKRNGYWLVCGPGEGKSPYATRSIEDTRTCEPATVDFEVES